LRTQSKLLDHDVRSLAIAIECDNNLGPGTKPAMIYCTTEIVVETVVSDLVASAFVTVELMHSELVP
jgi:hypothetical protein